MEEGRARSLRRLKRSAQGLRRRVTFSTPTSELKPISKHEFSQPKRVLVVPLSRLTIGKFGDDSASRNESWKILRARAAQGRTSIGALDVSIPAGDDPLARAMSSNIVQPFRAIEPHPSLEAIYLVPSVQSGGATGAFMDLAGQLFPVGARPAIYVVKRAGHIQELPYPTTPTEFIDVLDLWSSVDEDCISYDDYEGLLAAFKRAVDHARDEHAIDHEDICIDITSGQKAVSVAAAIVTLNRDLLISYVERDRVMFHDARLDARSFLDRLA